VFTKSLISVFVVYMIRSLNFVTTNTGKVSTLRNKLGEDFEVNQIQLEIVEPQADSVEDIVKIKAQSAYAMVGETVVVHDTGFIIPALNNFPGPYIKFVLETVGIQGILDLMKNKGDRSCYFIGSVCIHDGQSEKIFTNKGNVCQLATEIRGQLPANAWSPLWQIVIPQWSEGRTYAEVGQEGMKNREKSVKGKFEIDQLVDYLKTTLPVLS
jgi:non-canonical purine NTP pyrophosphatase (RdgB/HAM1 family)